MLFIGPLDELTLRAALSITSKEKAKLKAENSSLNKQLETAQAEASAWRSSHIRWQAYAKKLEATLEHTRAALRILEILTPKPKQSTQAIPPELLEELIKLCHPDKHSNNPQATEVTKRLLAMRTKGKKK